ncbi:MAG: hypothetical protein GF355_07740 [Candidatus Eisenbacteria bacterium]|nr:hypothetical protein [Candidatus Eisenbacteria bacterium]
MEFEILAAESLGVRSLAVRVSGTVEGTLLIDPGAALGPRRSGFPPHPLEEEALGAAEQRILKAAEQATRIIISHYHHDHFVPFESQRWIVSGPQTAQALYGGKTVYARDPDGPINTRQRGRAIRLGGDLAKLGVETLPNDGRVAGDLRFSPPMRHGDRASPGGWVVMAALAAGGERLVHMSDTQLLNGEALEWTLEQQPDSVVTAGPPLYLPQLTPAQRGRAERHLLLLVERVPYVVLDHHLLRGGEPDRFLERARKRARDKGHRLVSAAAHCGKNDDLLEARRRRLHADSG